MRGAKVKKAFHPLNKLLASKSHAVYKPFHQVWFASSIHSIPFKTSSDRMVLPVFID
jgi:hypothetical protein